VAWASEDGLSRLAKGIIDNLDAFVRGEPINVVS
jgi:lactate dehydrogenase-like 2-hydroxyacid dehydrogenase